MTEDPSSQQSILQPRDDFLKKKPETYQRTFSEDDLNKALNKRYKGKAKGNGGGSGKLSIDRNRLMAFNFLCRTVQVKNWLEAIFQDKFGDTPDEFINRLKDGSLLCELANRIQPNSIKKIHKKSDKFSLDGEYQLLPTGLSSTWMGRKCGYVYSY